MGKQDQSLGNANKQRIRIQPIFFTSFHSWSSTHKPITDKKSGQIILVWFKNDSLNGIKDMPKQKLYAKWAMIEKTNNLEASSTSVGKY